VGMLKCGNFSILVTNYFDLNVSYFPKNQVIYLNFLSF